MRPLAKASISAKSASVMVASLMSALIGLPRSLQVEMRSTPARCSIVESPVETFRPQGSRLSVARDGHRFIPLVRFSHSSGWGESNSRCQFGRLERGRYATPARCRASGLLDRTAGVSMRLSGAIVPQRRIGLRFSGSQPLALPLCYCRDYLHQSDTRTGVTRHHIQTGFG